MDQERIAKFIKEIRTQNKLSQNEFAKKYGVTYQAVSKWENGKNIPDISILTQICSDYNMSIEELLNGTKKEKKSNKFIIISIIGIILTIITSIIIVNITKEEDTFEFKTLSSLSEEFSLTGSIAYNQEKTSIYISNVEYKGKENNIEYKNITSTLYEIDGKTKTEIGIYEKPFIITLDKFLNSISFNIDNHARTCEKYTEESLLLEITATDKENKQTKFEIPIKIDENCQK